MRTARQTTRDARPDPEQAFVAGQLSLVLPTASDAEFIDLLDKAISWSDDDPLGAVIYREARRRIASHADVAGEHNVPKTERVTPPDVASSVAKVESARHTTSNARGAGPWQAQPLSLCDSAPSSADPSRDHPQP